MSIFENTVSGSLAANSDKGSTSEKLPSGSDDEDDKKKKKEGVYDPKKDKKAKKDYEEISDIEEVEDSDRDSSDDLDEFVDALLGSESEDEAKKSDLAPTNFEGKGYNLENIPPSNQFHHAETNSVEHDNETFFDAGIGEVDDDKNEVVVSEEVEDSTPLSSTLDKQLYHHDGNGSSISVKTSQLPSLPESPSSSSSSNTQDGVSVQSKTPTRNDSDEVGSNNSNSQSLSNSEIVKKKDSFRDSQEEHGTGDLRQSPQPANPSNSSSIPSLLTESNGINGNSTNSTPNSTNSELATSARQLPTNNPSLTPKIPPEPLYSVFGEFDNEPIDLAPPLDFKKDGIALVKQLDQNMKREMRESIGGVFSKPSAQGNQRYYDSGAKFVTMEEYLDQLSHIELALGLSDSPQPMTEEERAMYEAMTDDEKRLHRWTSIINELVETEESFSRDLYILCSYFFKILQNVQYISREEKDAICRNGDDIARNQEDFCDSLKEAALYDKHNKSVKHIANCFIEAKSYFQSYFDYSMGQERAINVYNRLVKTNSHFRDLDERLHLFHRISWGSSRLKFEDYLIMPFQRLFRYKLLLHTLEKATYPTSVGYERLSEAEDIIHNVAIKINDSKAKVELEAKTEIFLSRLESDGCLPQQWYNHLGPCSLIGTLEMRYLSKQRSSKRMCCALFEHYLILAKPKKPDVYESKHWFPIREFRVEDLPDVPTSLHFPWLLRNKLHTFEFSAVSKAEKDIWTTNMKKCITIANESYALSRKDSNKYLVEHLFVSSLDPETPRRINERMSRINLDSKPSVRIPIPSGSTSFSQSAIFSKPARSNNRLSIPNFSSLFYSPLDNLQSPTFTRYTFGGVLTDRFTSYRLKLFKARCDAFDANFKDVYLSCLVTSKGSLTRSVS